MGLFQAMRDYRDMDRGNGTVTVIRVSEPDRTRVAQRYRLEGMLQGPNVQPCGVVHKGMAPTAKWPKPGDVLPVTVLRRWPVKVRVEWDYVDD